jgi:hypothetical protein
MISTEQARQYAERTRQVLVESGAIIEHNHFVYDSGEHGSGWIDKDVVNEYTDRERASAPCWRRPFAISALRWCADRQPVD